MLAAELTDLLRPDPANARDHTARGLPLLPDDVLLTTLAGWIRRVVINSQGVVVDRGRRARAFTGEAAEAARLLVTMCESTGCTLPEESCQIDHMTEWQGLGETDQDSAAIACGHCNRDKHRRRSRASRDRHGRVQIQRPDGTWMTPVGVEPPTEADFALPEHVAKRLGPPSTIWQRAA